MHHSDVNFSRWFGFPATDGADHALANIKERLQAELASRLPSIALDVEKSIDFSNGEKILIEGISKAIADRSARLQRIFEHNMDSR